MSPESPSPSLEEIILHNQSSWRNREKGWRTLSSPVEVNPSAILFGYDTFDRITSTFGSFMHEAYKNHRPLIGLSVFQDMPDLDIGSDYWTFKTNYLNRQTRDFNEAKVIWLTRVARGKNPLKWGFIQEHSVPNGISQAYMNFVTACNRGLSEEDITEALARNHFQADNRALDNIFPYLFTEAKQSFTQYIHERGQHIDTIALRKEIKTRETGKALNQIITAIARPSVVGSVRVPGIVNLEVKTDLFITLGSIYLMYLVSKGELLPLYFLTPFPLTEIVMLFDKKDTVMHELIHATGVIEKHNQGFPGHWKKVVVS